LGGIVGVFALDGRSDVSSDTERMAAASLLPACESTVTASNVTVWFDGRLDNREDLARFLPPSSSRLDDASDAALVLAAYHQYGENVARALNGDFALAIADEPGRRLVLARDVMASCPLYYCPLPGTLLFASEIKCLLAHPGVTAAIDDDALAELVLDYWCDAHRTCFKGIFSVPPGEAVVASGGRVERRPQWTFDPMRQVRCRSFGDYRDRFRDLFEQAVRRRLQGSDRVAVAVSGGLDSSAILCTAADIRVREALPVALQGISITFPAGTAADERHFLDDIERRWPLPIERVPMSDHGYLQPSREIAQRLDAPGSLGREQAALFETARRTGCRVLLSGFFGDQMLAETAYFVDLARRFRWLKLRHDLRAFGDWMTEIDPDDILSDFRRHVVRALPPRWLFRIAKRVVRRSRAHARYPPWFTAAFCRRAEARALERFDEPRQCATAHAERYYLHATAGHYINFVRCDRAAAQAYDIDVRYPFRDRDLVEFLMAIPGEIVNWQGVPKGLLRHALSDVLPESIRDRRWKADFTPIENQGTARGAAQVASMLTPEAACVQVGIVDLSRRDALVTTSADLDDDAGPQPGWRLADVVGLEVWLRRYFGGSAYERTCACFREPAGAYAAVPEDVLAVARANSVHLLLADRMSLHAPAAELREAAVVEALRARELRDVLSGLAEAGVRPVLLKGAALAYTHYSRPELRPRSDTDLMIPLEARDDVARALTGLGYERPPEADGELAFGQFHFVKTDGHGLSHALDVHWRVSNVRAFADVLTYEELARDAVTVPALGPHAWAPSPVHALLVACIHRVAHHADTSDLLWLYDVHVLARSLTRAERDLLAGLAASRRTRAVCVRSLTLAHEAFGGLDLEWIESLSSADAGDEPTAAFVGGGLRQVDILKSDLAATPWASRVRLLREHLFPPPLYMRRRYPRWPALLLPLAYAYRIVGGAPRWLRR
jgi:asparagine synthase (glutamine-hydrolysing)